MLRTIFERARILFEQFSLWGALRLFVAEAVRKFLDPCQIASYSQTGEDRVMDFLLDSAKPGFYVDVGCHHPFAKSNTMRLYKRGWRGLCIDANEVLIALFQKARPRDDAVCAAVSNKPGRQIFTLMKRPELSTLKTVLDASNSPTGEVMRNVEVEVKTLQSLLETHNVPNRFELLSIDCEGHDYEVLTSFDITVFRPSVIICEMHGFVLSSAVDNPVYTYLIQNGYTLKGFAVWNGFFVDSHSCQS